MGQLAIYNQLNLFGADNMLNAFLDTNDICFIIKNEISPLIKDTDFEDMYKNGGRNPISPRVLMLTTLLQFIERLPDRAAAINLKYRLDWKIAFGLELDFPGIHHTTLVYFRDRLIENEKASYMFDKIIERLTELGLIKKKSKQRIDSTHIVGKIRELSRLELLHETLRVFCNDVDNEIKNKMDSNLLETYNLYLEKISIRGITDAQKEKYIKEAALAMKTFICWASFEPTKIKELQSFKIMVDVFKQNFEDNLGPDNPPKLIKIATGRDHICSPHEHEARYAKKGNKTHIGYKVQVSETITDNSEDVNFITHINLQDATTHDSEAVSTMIDETTKNGIEPSELYGDTHYNTSSNIEDLREKGIDLKGPVAPKPNKEINDCNKGFEVLEDEETVLCPEGKRSKKYTIQKSGRVTASFSKEDCNNCQRKDICNPQTNGKKICKRPEGKILKDRRSLMKTEEFKKDNYKRNGIEGTISGLVRGQSMRVSRYRGKKKTEFQMKFIGAAANLIRLQRSQRIFAPNKREIAA
jgi:transposase